MHVFITDGVTRGEGTTGKLGLVVGFRVGFISATCHCRHSSHALTTLLASNCVMLCSQAHYGVLSPSQQVPACSPSRGTASRSLARNLARSPVCAETDTFVLAAARDP